MADNCSFVDETADCASCVVPRTPPGLRASGCYRVTAIKIGKAAYRPTAAGLKGGKLYVLEGGGGSLAVRPQSAIPRGFDNSLLFTSVAGTTQ